MAAKRQIRGETYNVAELVDSAIAAADSMVLDLENARQCLGYMGHRNPSDEMVTRYARESAILAVMTRATGAAFSGQIGKIRFTDREQTIADVNSYLNRRNQGQRSRWTASHK
jgi:hypothetical protein